MTASQFCAWLRCGALVLCSPVFIAPAGAAGEPQPTADGRGLPTHVVAEGGAERPLWIDSGRVADFGKQGTRGPLIRPVQAEDAKAAPSGKSDAGTAVDGAAQVSPLFLDDAGQPRALPGGVIVSLKEVLPEPQARAELQAAGLVPLHRIGERMWLVDSPVGIESLHLADRLQAEGRYEFVQPNWWRPRATK